MHRSLPGWQMENRMGRGTSIFRSSLWFTFCCSEVYKIGEMTWSDWSFRELILVAGGGMVWKGILGGRRPIRRLLP